MAANCSNFTLRSDILEFKIFAAYKSKYSLIDPTVMAEAQYATCEFNCLCDYHVRRWFTTILHNVNK